MIKRQKISLSMFSVFIIVAICLFFFWSRLPSQEYKYDVSLDDVVNGYARSPVILHATIKSDTSSGSLGWDLDNDSVIDLNAVLIDPTRTYEPLDYHVYQPWKMNATENERRYYAYSQFNQSGNYSLMFLFRGVDGWYKKQINVCILDPMIDLTVMPITTPFNSGDNIIFRATVKNEGPFPIWIRDPNFNPGSIDAQIIIPNGTIVEEYDPHIPGQGQQQQGGSIHQYGFGRLDAGQTWTIDNNFSFNLSYKTLYFGNSSLGIYEYKFNDIGTFEVKLEYYFGISGTLNLGKSDSSIFYTEFQVV